MFCFLWPFQFIHLATIWWNKVREMKPSGKVKNIDQRFLFLTNDNLFSPLSLGSWEGTTKILSSSSLLQGCSSSRNSVVMLISAINPNLARKVTAWSKAISQPTALCSWLNIWSMWSRKLPTRTPSSLRRSYEWSPNSSGMVADTGRQADKIQVEWELLNFSIDCN